MEPLNAAKFVAGYGITGFAKAFAIGSKIAIIVALGWFIYVGMIKPHTNPTPTNYQNAQRDFHNTNVYREDSRFIGLKAGWFKLGIDIPKRDKKVEPPKKLK